MARTVIKPAYYNVHDVMKFYDDCSESYAYGVIRRLRKELKDKGFEPGPAGKINKKYFEERCYLGSTNERG